MGRAPCCEKMGLKKGPWTPDEDQILINYINTYGHANWRALPKHAGLLRCGKSCRLRWANYLRPDIKRGNFTREEEETIINLHEKLGNRWSAIAARLPGRTDNEIKNVWHTHLKKRLPQNQECHEEARRKPKKTKKLDSDAAKQEQQQQQPETKQDRPLSPPQSSSDMSTLTTTSDYNSNEHNINNNHDMSINNNNTSSCNNDNNNIVDSPANNDLALDEDFWSEVLSADNSVETSDRNNNFPATIINGVEQEFQFSFFAEEGVQLAGSNSSTMCDGMDFWYDVYARAEELTELPELSC